MFEHRQQICKPRGKIRSSLSSYFDQWERDFKSCRLLFVIILCSNINKLVNKLFSLIDKYCGPFPNGRLYNCFEMSGYLKAGVDFSSREFLTNQ